MFIHRISMKVRRHIFAACLLLCTVIFLLCYMGLHRGHSITLKPVRESITWINGIRYVANQTTASGFHGTTPANGEAFNNPRKLNEVALNVNMGLNLSSEMTKISREMGNKSLVKKRGKNLNSNKKPKAPLTKENRPSVFPKHSPAKNRSISQGARMGTESLQPPANLLSGGRMPLKRNSSKTKELQGSIEKQHDLFLKAYQDVVRRNKILEQQLLDVKKQKSHPQINNRNQGDSKLNKQNVPSSKNTPKLISSVGNVHVFSGENDANVVGKSQVNANNKNNMQDTRKSKEPTKQRESVESYSELVKKVLRENSQGVGKKLSLLDQYLFPVRKGEDVPHPMDMYQNHKIHDGVQNFERKPQGQQREGGQKELLYKFEREDEGHEENSGNKRRDSCDRCMKLRFKYLLNASSVCSNKASKALDLLILISSTPASQEDRMAIRKTWGEVCNKPESNIACVFMIAVSDDEDENQLAYRESRVYKDIVVFSFMDAYTNLTYKTLMGMKWSQEFCPQAKYVMKTDQDVYVNTHQIPIMLQAAPNAGFSGGFCWGLSRPHREPDNKWRVSYEEFSDDYFPPMCSGTGYILSRDTVISILKVSQNIPFFTLEDVYVALCLQELGIQPINIQGFSNMKTQFEACEYKHYVMTSHQVSGAELIDNWEEIQACPDHNFAPRDLYHPIHLPDLR